MASPILNRVALDPKLYLALSLSAPAQHLQKSLETHLELDISDQDVRVTIPTRAERQDRSGRLLASKETIAFGLLLYNLWEARYQKEENSLIFRMHKLARVTADFTDRDEGRILQEVLHPERCFEFNKHFQDPFEIDEKLVNQADQDTLECFRVLESEDLAIDPGITGATGLMVLLGLIPVRWSVRTPKGESVYREIQIRAGLWTLDIKKRRKGRVKFTDWDFNFRGVSLVRRLLRELATEYFESESETKRNRGKPNLGPPDDIEIEGD